MFREFSFFFFVFQKDAGFSLFCFILGVIFYYFIFFSIFQEDAGFPVFVLFCFLGLFFYYFLFFKKTPVLPNDSSTRR